MITLFRSAFFRRLYLPYLMLICVAVGGAGIFAAVRLRSTYLVTRDQALRDHLSLLADQVGALMAEGRIAELNDRLRAIGEKVDMRFTVIAEDGNVLADNWADPASMGSHRGRAEVAATIVDGEAFRTRVSDTVDREMRYFAKQLQTPDGQRYYLRLAVPLSDLREHVIPLFLAMGGAALFLMAVGAVFSYHLARRQAEPVVELTNMADAISRGQLDQRTYLVGTDSGEIGTLGSALNKMAAAIRGLMHEGQKDKSELLAILGSMAEGVVATDTQQRVMVVNEAAGKLLGFNPQHAAGKPLWQVVRLDRMMKAAQDVLSTGEKRQFEVAMIGGRHLEICLVPYPAAEPRQGLVVVVHDTTQSVRYQELRKEFVANVSHELRTPLTVIKGFVETLRDGAIHDAVKGPEYLATIERHTNQLGNLVNDLLELSRLESQPDLPRRVSVDVSAVARRAVELLISAAERKGQTLTIETQRLPMIAGNPDYLERAVANLVDNAIKYTPEKGHIRVATKMSGNLVTIEVSDNGIGVPVEDQPRIFERFYRVDRSRSREMGGTGLGLSIVKHIVQAHGGTTDVTSTVGQGSTFRIKLPLPQAELAVAG